MSNGVPSVRASSGLRAARTPCPTRGHHPEQFAGEPPARGGVLDPALQEVHCAMMRHYFDDGWSAGAVAKAFGRSPGFIAKLVRAEKASGRVRTRTGGSTDPRRRENRRPLSPAHSSIAIHVLRYRRASGLNMTQFGLRVRLSRVRVGEMEAGAYDLTLREILAIAHELDLEPSVLLAGHVRAARAR